jgi:hypothetical protein
VRYTTGSREELPGERRPLIKDDDDNNNSIGAEVGQSV